MRPMQKTRCGTGAEIAIYLILTVAVFTLSPLIYEVLHRIPFIRWCVFGEKKSDRNKSVVH